MGGQASSAKSDIVKESVNEILVKNIVNCSYVVNQEQGINITGNGNVIEDVTMKQTFLININCLNIVKDETRVLNEIAEKVVQKASAEGEVLVGALGRERSEVISNIINKIKTQINKQNVMNCTNNINSSQVISISGNNNIIKSVTLEQHQKNITDCIQNLVLKTELMTELSSEVDNSAAAKQNGLFSFLSSWTGVLIIIIILVIVAYYYMNRSPQGMAMQGMQGMAMYQQPQYRPPPRVQYPQQSYESYAQPYTTPTPSAPPSASAPPMRPSSSLKPL